MGVVCSREGFELVQFKNNRPWAFGEGDRVTLPGAHGSEIVRAFCFLDEVSTCSYSFFFFFFFIFGRRLGTDEVCVASNGSHSG